MKSNPIIVILRLLLRNRVVFFFVRHPVFQTVLESIVFEVEYLMGIGSGAGTDSGEMVLGDLVDNRDGDAVIFDVGAHKGELTDIILSKVSRSSTFYLFEPQSALFDSLSEKYAGWDDIYVTNAAISDEVSERRLHYDSEGSSLASLTNRDLSHFDIDFDKSDIVRTTTIDRFCRENDIEHIDLLKLDIEGHELEALHGTEEMLKSGSIRFISFEFGGANIDTQTYFRDFYRFFDECGYRLYRILPGGYLYDIGSYDEAAYEKFRTANYVAAPKSETIERSSW